MSLKFIKEKLKEYYLRKGVEAPPDFKRREFGFGDDKKIDYRHVSFKTEEELNRFFVDKAPLYASFSTAYYEFPSKKPMEAKGFLGSDLVFEFDAECNHNTLTCEDCLEKTKQDAIKLIEEFLIPDFGFDEKELKVSFSGNRGYHIYVFSEAVRHLNSKARREMVDYVQGNKLNVRYILKQNPTPDSPGWYGRIARTALEIAKTSNSKAFADREKAVKLISQGNYSFFKGLEGLIEKNVVKRKARLAADVDQSVTLDLSRLIRIPSTIHGGSSLLCTFVKNLDSFNPFKHAVVFFNPPVKVKFLADVSEFCLKDQCFGPFRKEEVKELPEYAAMFLACKKAVEVLE